MNQLRSGQGLALGNLNSIIGSLNSPAAAPIQNKPKPTKTKHSDGITEVSGDLVGESSEGKSVSSRTNDDSGLGQLPAAAMKKSISVPKPDDEEDKISGSRIDLGIPRWSVSPLKKTKI